MIFFKSLFRLHQSKKLINYKANPFIIFAILNVMMAVLIINRVTIAMPYNTSRHTKMQ